MYHHNAFCHLNSWSSLSFSFIRQAKSHRQLWIILTFHFHNSPLLLFFLSTGFKSQAGAWERKTVCLNLCIVFSALLSKPLLCASDLFCMLCFAMPGTLCLEEITVTCQRSIKRGKISTLTFSRGLMFQARMGCLRGRRGEKREEGQRERDIKKMQREPNVWVQCADFQAHPKLMLHLVRFSPAFPPHFSVARHLYSITRPAFDLLKRQSWLLKLFGDSLASSF